MAKTEKRPRVGGVIISLEERRSPDQLANIEAEAAVLGAVLRDPAVYASVSEMLQPSDFFLLWHGFVWFGFEQITARNQAIDLISVADELEARHQLGSDGILRLARLAGDVPSAYSVETYAQIVRGGATRLRVMRAASEMVTAAFDRQQFGDIETFIDECDRLLFQATDQAIAKEATSLTQVLGDYLEQVDQAMTTGLRRGVASGFGNLDDLLRGAVPGELTVIAGAEGMGKTTLLLNIARNVAKAGQTAVIFTLEMSKEEIARIFLSMESGLPKRALKALDFSGNQYAQLIQGAGRFADWNTHIIDEFPSLTPIQVRRRLRTLIEAQKQAVDVVIIDGLWLMEDTDHAQERHEAVGHITRDLILVARDFAVPIYIAQQYNGDAYKRNDKHPLLHDLAESAGVRRNAQVILGLYRDSYYGLKRGEVVSELHVLKDRNGSGAQGNHADFYFDGERNLFLAKAEGGLP